MNTIVEPRSHEDTKVLETESKAARSKAEPDLRFTEFSGDWRKIKLGDAGKVSMCKRIMKDETKPIGSIPFFKIGTFGKEPDAFITKELFEEYKQRFSFPKNGDILISAAGTIGRTVVFDGEPAYFQDSNIVWIDNNEDKVINPFLSYCYQNIRWITDDTTIARLYNDNLRSQKLFIPTLPEQQKIADFLSSVDKKIEQLTEKHRLLCEYKKGVMQQIFTQQIRFKDNQGNDYPEWKCKKIKDLFTYKNGGAFESDVIKDGLYNLITLNSIDINGELKANHKTIGYTDNSLSKNDLIMVLSDVAHGNFLGLTAIIPENNKYILNQRMGALKSKTADDPQFMRTYINFHQKYFKLHGQGSSQQNLSKGDIEKFVINSPCEEEQQKIANFLTEIDQKIDQAWSTLEQTKAFKKGLLQQMFV